MSRRLGLSASRTGIAALNLTALGALAVAAACSSSSAPISAGGGDDSGTSSGSTSSGASSGSSGDDGGGTSSSATSSSGSPSSSSGTSTSSGSGSGSTSRLGSTGDGGSCTPVTDAWIGVKISFNVEWGQGGASGSSVASDPGGPAPVYIWLLSHEMGGATFMGTAQACGTVLPDLELNLAGDVAVGGVASGASGLVNPAIANSTFDAITRMYKNSGTQGFNIGDSITTTATLGLLGLSNSSTYDMAATAWPAYCASNATCTGATCTGGTCSGGAAGPFTGTDVTDDDKDGNPGVTATPLMGSTTCPRTRPTRRTTRPRPARSTSRPRPLVSAARPRRPTRSTSCRASASRSRGSGATARGAAARRRSRCSTTTSWAATSRAAAIARAPRRSSSTRTAPSTPTRATTRSARASGEQYGTVDVYQFDQGTTPTCAMVRSMLP